MPQLSGIYDSFSVQPVARIKQNLAIWTLGQWAYYRIEYQEGIPPGPASTVDMVAVAGLATLAAAGTIVKQIVPALQLNKNEFMHLRWEPLDNVEGVLWELGGQARLNTRRIQCRVDRNTWLRDPAYATTTFWILGIERDMNLEVRNPMAMATPFARFIFWGWRYILSELKPQNMSSDPRIAGQEMLALQHGDLAMVEKKIGPVTWLPAEGRQS